MLINIVNITKNHQPYADGEKRIRMKYTYKTKGTCSTQITFDIEDDVITNVQYTGGCNGNLKAVRSLVEGMTVEQIEKKLGGIKCGFKNTSCGDQLAKAVREAYQSTH